MNLRLAQAVCTAWPPQLRRRFRYHVRWMDEALAGGFVYDITDTVLADHSVRSVAETLAEETHQPVELVEQVYASERQALESRASITTYIDVLAIRRAKLILKACELQ